MPKRPTKKRVVIKDLPVPPRQLTKKQMQNVRGGA
jgi:hypothetical protein